MAAASLEADTSLPASVRQDLSVLRRNVELEARLIDDLLDLTRIVRGKIELRSEVVNVHAIVTDAMNICRTDISAKRQELVLVLRASEFHVNGDAVRIQQILWNLLLRGDDRLRVLELDLESSPVDFNRSILPQLHLNPQAKKEFQDFFGGAAPLGVGRLSNGQKVASAATTVG